MAFEYPDFLSRSAPKTAIIYGQVTNPLRLWEAVNAGGDGLEPLSSQHALIQQSHGGFRLSSPGWMDFTFNERMTLTQTSELFLLCREKIMRSVSDFALPLRRFLEAYLDFVWAQTKTLQEEHKATGAGGGLFSAEDWGFSGWLPLPQAYILLPPTFDGGCAQFAEVDVVFWGAQRLIAVCLEGAGTPPPSKQRKRRYLFDEHPALDVISISREQVAEGQFPADLFPVALTRYWRDLPNPLGPAPPRLVLQTPS
ncbi:MAG: hypothetical protein CBD27_08140 [Rhodospirillaceae bacterium TMED167]|nr:MAG: hypothetical protein CBD27_08140 [Rhodospirillaceae bacterium TMED167]